MAATSSNKILRIYMDVTMSKGHDGLAEIVKRDRKTKLSISTLKPGQFVAFVNRKQTAFKMFSAGNTVLHHKTKDGGRVSMRALSMVPHFFHGGDAAYNKALEHVLRRDYPQFFASQEELN